MATVVSLMFMWVLFGFMVISALIACIGVCENISPIDEFSSWVSGLKNEQQCGAITLGALLWPITLTLFTVLVVYLIARLSNFLTKCVIEFIKVLVQFIKEMRKDG